MELGTGANFFTLFPLLPHNTQRLSLLKKWAIPASFSLFSSFQYTVGSIQMLNTNKFLPMTGFELRTSGIGSNCCTNWATITAQHCHLLSLCHFLSLSFYLFLYPDIYLFHFSLSLPFSLCVSIYLSLSLTHILQFCLAHIKPKVIIRRLQKKCPIKLILAMDRRILQL